MNQMVIGLVFILGLSGCTSMGTRAIEVDVTKEGEAHVRANSGTKIRDGFNGVLIVECSPTTSGGCLVYIDGSGGAVDPTEGHRATVDTVSEGGKIVGEITEGAVRGFAP